MACIQVLLDINAYASPKKRRMEGGNDYTGASNCSKTDVWCTVPE